jgi:predicted DNA binding protein
MLSDRQREALEVAVELGYYDTPREATHTDIAAELDCAPNTASDHLQKGEAKLVRAGLTAFPSSL